MKFRQYVVGICGHDTEDDLALLEDGSHYPNTYFVLIDREQINFYGKALLVRSGLIYQDNALFFVDFQPELHVDYLVNYNNEPFLGKTLVIPNIIRDDVRNYLFKKDVTSNILQQAGLLTPQEVCMKLACKRADGSRMPLNHDHNPCIDARTATAPNIKYINHDLLATGCLPFQPGFLAEFLARHKCDEGVFKPNNGGGGEDVYFFSHGNHEEKEQALRRLLHDGNDVLLQERIIPPLVTKGTRLKDWNLRTFITRDQNGHPIVRDMLARIHDQGGPVNVAQGAQVCLLEEIAVSLSWSRATLREVRDLAVQSSARAYLAICRAIAEDCSCGKDESYPDILGADIIVRQKRGRWQAYIIEMDINPGGAWEFNHRLRNVSHGKEAVGGLSRRSLKAREGGASHDWIRLMIHRCHQQERRPGKCD